jgi:hypothetical protein
MSETKKQPGEGMRGMRQAVLVLGAESSGTRWLTRLLIAARLAGSADGPQWDEPSERLNMPPRIVWRRSLPYGGGDWADGRRWPDLAEELLLPLIEAGFTCGQIHALVIVRDPAVVAASQIERGFVADAAAARSNMREAYGRIGQFLWAEGIESAWISYESFLTGGGYSGLRRLLADWSIDLPADIDLPTPDRSRNAQRLGLI